MAVLLTGTLAGCMESARLPLEAGIGTTPDLPPPDKSMIPTVNVAKAVGWDRNKPKTAGGLQVQAFAEGLDHPRWLLVLPNGDVLVAESNAPAKKESGGIRAWVMGVVMKRAGARTPSADRITLLRDADGDGRAELKTPFIQGLTSPFGMALVGTELFVANTDAVMRFPYSEGQTSIDVPGQRLAELPAGDINHHWTKSLIASADGTKLYATVGSNSNVAENGLEAEQGRAAIWEIDLPSGEKRLFATGLRNPNGMAWEPRGGVLWTVVNERDEIGSDLVPDYLTSVRRDGFYGWPYSYYGTHVDERVKPPRPDLVAKARVPDYALGAHTASLGLAWSDGMKGWPMQFGTGMFIGQHGSWNRRPASGYKVIFVPFETGQPKGLPIDVLTGFLNDDGEAQGRPVGVALDGKGALLVADDVGNAVWRVSAGSAQ
ncbi:sorbosone dehydrogenase family protein [Variovorax dokdonensis]|uniref:Sorbosone dehydrogenase family protein n=1 Tax=Variovorax dokdonensis TaxID=344883 RepID=A0ABT7N9B9_9BURK|nr:sorbosone dehydrogenase family protein [Variovorax dokdonensis]MDM0044470.1 sorbosone dehydrogenase family protein [Variovorax dokdonensis]